MAILEKTKKLFGIGEPGLGRAGELVKKTATTLREIREKKLQPAIKKVAEKAFDAARTVTEKVTIPVLTGQTKVQKKVGEFIDKGREEEAQKLVERGLAKDVESARKQVEYTDIAFGALSAPESVVKQAAKPVATSLLGRIKGRLLSTEKKAEIATRKNIIEPIERALGEKQAQQFAVKRQWENITNKIQKKDIISPEEHAALFNFFDNPQQYPISPELQQKAGDDLIQNIREFKQFLTKQQTERGLLHSIVDDDEYMRTFLMQLDGSVPTPAQLNELQKLSSKSLTKRLFGINKDGGVSGLSTKNRYDQMRKFVNADLRDEYLKQFGLKTNRNFIDVMRRTVRQVSDVTSNYDFVQSLRKQAREGIEGVREIYDPQVFREFKEDQFSRLKVVRESILEKARTEKQITEEEYKIFKANTKDIIDSLRGIARKDADLPVDLRNAQVEQLNSEISLAKEYLLGDLKTTKRAITEKAKSQIEAIKKDVESKIIQKVDEITDKFVQATGEGYKRPKNVMLAQQVTGILLDEHNAKALEKIFEILKPSSVDDLIRGMKLVQATGDLFQVPEVFRQRFGTLGLKGLLEQWRFTEEDFYEKGLDAIRHGLVLGKPADIDVELVKKMGQNLEEIEKSSLSKFAQKTGQALEEIPGVGKVKEKVASAFQKLEDFQWRMLVPQSKLSIYEAMVPKMRQFYPDLTDEEARVLSASFVNDTFQGLNWERIMTKNTPVGRALNKRVTRNLRFAFFGPDRLSSVAARYTKGFKKYGAPYRKFWFRSAFFGAALLETLNYAFSGHSTLENKKGSEFELEIPFIKDEKGNPMSINILGTWTEPLKAINKPSRFIFNKEGIAPKFAGVGTPDIFKAQSFPELFWDVVPAPFTFKGFLENLLANEPGKRTGETDIPTAALQSALEFSGFPSVFRSGTNKEATITDLVKGDSTFFEYISSRIPQKQKTPAKSGVRRVKVKRLNER